MSAARTLCRAQHLAALATVVVVAGGCGGGGGKPSSDTRGGTPRPGGTLTLHTAFEPFSLDPANALGTEALVLANVHRPLFRRESRRPDGLAPDIAAAAPEIGDGGRTLTVRIRRGVRFAPPVGREVTAADVRYAIERGRTPRVASPPAGAYMAEVTRIDVPDPYTLVFRLSRPYARAVAGALTMTFSAPVPREYARRFDRGKRSTYGEHAVATGPYMIEADRDGRLTGYKPGRYLRMVRNPNWNRETDFRPAYVDRIEMRLGATEQHLRSQRVLEGKGAISIDPPSRVSLKQALSGPRRRQIVVASGGPGMTVFAALNTRVPPFDDVNVRRAVVAAFDRELALLSVGGPRVAHLATHFLPPEIRGFAESGGMRGPGFDFLRSPGGDLDVAAAYMRRAGYPSGRYTGREAVLVVGANEPALAPLSQVAREALVKLGFRVRLRELSFQTLLSRYCARSQDEAAMCSTMNWVTDFDDGASALAPLFDGRSIEAAGFANTSQLDDPAVNRAIDRAKLESDPAARARAWAEVDRLVTSLAAVVPLQWGRSVWLRSENVELNAESAVLAVAFSWLR